MSSIDEQQDRPVWDPSQPIPPMQQQGCDPTPHTISNPVPENSDNNNPPQNSDIDIPPSNPAHIKSQFPKPPSLPQLPTKELRLHSTGTYGKQVRQQVERLRAAGAKPIEIWVTPAAYTALLVEARARCVAMGLPPSSRGHLMQFAGLPLRRKQAVTLRGADVFVVTLQLQRLPGCWRVMMVGAVN